MKKKLIVNAVSCSMATSLSAVSMMPSTVSADDSGPTVYGRFRVGLQRFDADSESEEVIGFEDASSRFGIKGEESLSESISAVYLYEWGTLPVEDEGAATGLSKRKSYVGLKKDANELTIGRRTNAFYSLIGTIYKLGEEYTANYAMFEVPGISDKTSDMLSYRYSGDELQLGVEISMDQDDLEGNDIDEWNVTARYGHDFGYLNAGYITAETSTFNDEGLIEASESDTAALFAEFFIGEGSLYLGGMFATQEQNGIDGEDVDSYHIGYSNRKDDLGYFVTYDQLDYETSDDVDIWTVALHFFISARTRIYLEAEFQDSQAEDSDSNSQVIGIRHDF